MPHPVFVSYTGTFVWTILSLAADGDKTFIFHTHRPPPQSKMFTTRRPAQTTWTAKWGGLKLTNQAKQNEMNKKKCKHRWGKDGVIGARVFLFIARKVFHHDFCQFFLAAWHAVRRPIIFPIFFFPPLLFSRRRSIDTGLLYWAASRHRLFLYWPVSRCACGREGVSPDLPLPCWEATDRHGGARVWKEVAERWKVSVMVVVGREIFEQQTGRKGSSCRMGKESWPTRDEGCAGEKWFLHVGDEIARGPDPVSLTSIRTSRGISSFMYGTAGVINTWNEIFVRKKLSNYAAFLHDNRLVNCILHWNPGTGRLVPPSGVQGP